MKFCPNCGAELKPEAKFCAACGTPIAVASPPPSQAAPPPPPPVYQQEPVYEHAREASSAFKEAISGKTNILQRVINIITKPKQEWEVIATEQPDKMKILFGYIMILAIIPALVSFISFTFFYGSFSLGYAIMQTIISFSLMIAVLFIVTFIVEALAPSFESDKNFDRSFQLICYSFTPFWIISVLFLIPDITIIRLMQLISFGYITYIIIQGLPMLKKTPEIKVIGYGSLLGIAILFLYYSVEWLLKLIFLKAILGM